MVGVDARYHRGVRGGDRSRDHPPPDHRLHRSARLRPRNLPHGGRPPRGPMTRLLDAPERFGPLPQMGGGFIDAIEQSRLVGRGGAGFPVATKWRAVAQRSGGRAVIVVNGAEGEPRSQKDRLVMTWRPHLVLDGAFIAARVLHARRVILYIGERHEKARSAMLRALGERTEPEGALVTVAAAPARYVAGAESVCRGRVLRLLGRARGGLATPSRPRDLAPARPGPRVRRDRFASSPRVPRLRDGGHHALPRGRELGAVRAVLFWAQSPRRCVLADLRRQLGRQ